MRGISDPKLTAVFTFLSSFGLAASFLSPKILLEEETLGVEVGYCTKDPFLDSFLDFFDFLGFLGFSSFSSTFSFFRSLTFSRILSAFLSFLLTSSCSIFLKIGLVGVSSKTGAYSSTISSSG